MQIRHSSRTFLGRLICYYTHISETNPFGFITIAICGGLTIILPYLSWTIDPLYHPMVVQRGKSKEWSPNMNGICTVLLLREQSYSIN